MAAKPIVDGIEAQNRGELSVIRLNVQSNSAQPLKDLYDFRFTPTFVLFDGDGDEVLRSVGAIDPQQVQEVLETLP